MIHDELLDLESIEPERYEFREEDPYLFEMNRRQFVQVLGAGLMLTMASGGVLVEGAPKTRYAKRAISGRLHIGADGAATVMTGKVEFGQGARTEIAQAAAEELCLPLDRIRVVMADTDISPNDGGTFGSMTTPRTIPMVRRASAAAREILIDFASKKLDVDRGDLDTRDGRIFSRSSDASITYAALAESADLEGALKANVPADVEVSAVDSWEVLGTSAPKPTAKAIVTGAHKYPSDISRPGMLYGAVMRPPSYGAELKSVDLAPAQSLENVVPLRDGEFVGCVAPTSTAAARAVEAIAETAIWNRKAHPSSEQLYEELKAKAHTDPKGRPRPVVRSEGDVEAGIRDAAQTLTATYHVPYIQHVPLEPRAAVAEWEGDRLTVWTGSQVPTGVRAQLARTFRLKRDQVRVVIPDTGGGFGGKHTGEVAIEAARLARAAGRPVSLRWTREEEFTWAYFRPAGVIEIVAAMDSAGKITAWDFSNTNSGTSSIATPYAISHTRTSFYPCDSPLREGSYRALAATANSFARESMMDELASAVGADPLSFRLKHIEDERLRAVLEAAAIEFDWTGRRDRSQTGRAIGLSCSIDKNSYVAACVEIEFDSSTGGFDVLEVVQAYECGAILNPGNLRSQVEGGIVMGLGGALTEEIHFENGKILNSSLSEYTVPRFRDVPKIRTVLIDRTDLDSVGAGETPIIAVAPAIGNAVFAASGVRLRRLPLRSVPVGDSEQVARG